MEDCWHLLNHDIQAELGLQLKSELLCSKEGSLKFIELKSLIPFRISEQDPKYKDKHQPTFSGYLNLGGIRIASGTLLTSPLIPNRFCHSAHMSFDKKNLHTVNFWKTAVL